MSSTITVTATITTHDNYKRVTFASDVGTNTKPFPKVCLARTPYAKGKDVDGLPACSFALDNLAAHDHHTPPFTTIEAAEAYIARVAADVAKAVEEYRNKPIIRVIFAG